MPMSINSQRSAAIAMDQSRASAIVLMPRAARLWHGCDHGLDDHRRGKRRPVAGCGIHRPPQFSGPPPHWHKITTEIFYVLEGTLTLSAATRPSRPVRAAKPTCRRARCTASPTRPMRRQSTC